MPSTTTLTDSTADWIVNYWAGGTIWLEETKTAHQVISNTQTSVTFLGIVPGPMVGKGYSLANKDYPLDILRMAVNQSIGDLYAQPVESILTSVALQASYPLALGGVLSVQVADSQGKYHPHQGWHEMSGYLVFNAGQEVALGGINIKVITPASAEMIYSDAETVPESIDYQLLLWKAATFALMWGLQVYGQDPTKRINELIQKAETEVARRGSNRVILRKQTIVGAW